jgi:hypothetical protein
LNKNLSKSFFKIRINALNVLVIYERLDFFFNIFKNEKNIARAEEQKRMANEWLNGNLNGLQKGNDLISLGDKSPRPFLPSWGFYAWIWRK